jgi:hypothetical protein
LLSDTSSQTVTQEAAMSLKPIFIAAGFAAALTVGAVGGIAAAGAAGALPRAGSDPALASSGDMLAAVDLVGADVQTALDSGGGSAPGTATSPSPAAGEPGQSAAPGQVAAGGRVTAEGLGTRAAARLCARVPQGLTKTRALQARLSGDASTPGSLSWLQARIDAAGSAGRTQLAQVLTDRKRMLTDLQPALADRVTMLTDAQHWCGTSGSGS